MFVYSGKCRLGKVGDETPFTDVHGNKLVVGDIVVIYTEDYTPENLTVVVSDEFVSFSDGTHKIKDGPIIPFVMGIAGVDLNSPNEWRVLRVKSAADVIDGEHWKAYGFNYSSV